MEHKFLVELDRSSQYTKLRIFNGFLEWFEYKILNLATNLLQWFECLLSIKGLGALDHRGGKLVGENFMVGIYFEELVEEKGKACTINGKRCLKPYSPNWKPWCVMDSKHSKCAPIVRWRQSMWLLCGAQGVNQNIQLHPKHD